jgi:hypothetical protein
MGLFDFVGDVVNIGVRTAILPLAVVKDVIDIGEATESETGKQIEKLQIN